MKQQEKEIKEKDKKSIEDIYNRHASGLKGYISGRVSYKEDAEDILQNVFYQLSKIDLLENPIEHISSWLYSVARNQIIDRSRKHKEERLPVVKSDNGDDFLFEISEMIYDRDNSPEAEYFRTFVWEELEEALDELPAEQKNVFELTELEGFSFKELSETTGIPVNTLISRKRYAVLHLRQRLRGLYDELNML